MTEVDDAALDQIYLLRLELVALIGRAAPRPITAADLDAIRAVGEELKRMIATPGKPDIAAFSTHCEVFHNLVNKVIGSPMLKHFIEVLYHQADRYWYGWMEHTDRSARSSSSTTRCRRPCAPSRSTTSRRSASCAATTSR